MQLTRYRRPAWPQAVLQSPTTSRLPRSREQHYIAEVLLASSTHPLSSVSSRLNSISQEFKWPQFTVFFMIVSLSLLRVHARAPASHGICGALWNRVGFPTSSAVVRCCHHRVVRLSVWLAAIAPLSKSGAGESWQCM